MTKHQFIMCLRIDSKLYYLTTNFRDNTFYYMTKEKSWGEPFPSLLEGLKALRMYTNRVYSIAPFDKYDVVVVKEYIKEKRIYDASGDVIYCYD